MKLLSIYPILVIAILGLKISDKSRIMPNSSINPVTIELTNNEVRNLFSQSDFDCNGLISIETERFFDGDWQVFTYTNIACEVATEIENGSYDLGNTHSITVTFTNVTYTIYHTEDGGWVYTSANLPPRNKIKCPPSPWNTKPKPQPDPKK